MAAHTAIVIDWNKRTQTEIQNRLRKGATARGEFRPQIVRIAREMLAMAGAIGKRVATAKVQHCTAASVAAAGTVTYDYTQINANDTLVIGTVTLTAKSSGAAAGTQWNIGASNAAGTANLMAAINANTTLSKYFIATNPTATTVVVTALIPGSLPNMIATTDTSSGLTWGAATLAGGVGLDYATVDTLHFGT